MLTPPEPPNEVEQDLNAAMRASLANPELRNIFRDEGSEVMSMSADEFNQFRKNEATAINKLVADVGIQKQ